MIPTSSALRGGVGLHQRRFVGGQAVFLPQQRRELLVNLADVVQQRGGVHLFHVANLEAHFQRDEPGKLAHPQGVAGGVGVAGLDGLDHHLEEFLAALLQLVVETVHMSDCDDGDYHANKPEGS